MNEWIDFYQYYFQNLDEATKFVESCEKLTNDDGNHIAKIMMHQTKRLISLSDDMQKCRPNDETLKLLFLMMCVENISKLQDGFSKEGQSKKYVKKFFNDFLSSDDKNLLSTGFVNYKDQLRPLNLDNVIEMLYSIRNNIVHEGKYIYFSFDIGIGDYLQLIEKNEIPIYTVVPHITLKNFRDVIIRGCITAILSKL